MSILDSESPEDQVAIPVAPAQPFTSRSRFGDGETEGSFGTSTQVFNPTLLQPSGGITTVTLPSVRFVSPQPGQVFTADGLVRISVITSTAARLDFFARQVGGPGLVYLRSFGPVSAGSQTQLDVPASQIPFQSAVIQVDLYPSLYSAPSQAFSGQFFIQAAPTESNAQFTSPQGGEIWSCFQVQTVTWVFGGSPQRWEIAYSLNNGPFITVNNSIPGADRVYYFYPPFIPAATPARLRLRKVSSTGVIKDTISNVFTLTNY